MPSADSTDLPSFLCNERNVGPWRRTFTLPVDVDMKALKAGLEGGLLCIDLPRRDMTSEPMVKIEVQ
jgi:HSP20 family molecular chaperone IbpA